MIFVSWSNAQLFYHQINRGMPHYSSESEGEASSDEEGQKGKRKEQAAKVERARAVALQQQSKRRKATSVDENCSSSGGEDSQGASDGGLGGSAERVLADSRLKHRAVTKAQPTGRAVAVKERRVGKGGGGTSSAEATPGNGDGERTTQRAVGKLAALKEVQRRVEQKLGNKSRHPAGEAWEECA